MSEDTIFTIQEAAEALPKLWTINPLAQAQFFNIIMQGRLAAVQKDLADIEANGHQPAAAAPESRAVRRRKARANGVKVDA